METSTVFVAGASGLLGTEICRQRCEKDLTIKAMVRSATGPAKTIHLSNTGVQMIRGNLMERESQSNDLKGVITVITIVSSMSFSYKQGANDILRIDEDVMISLTSVNDNASMVAAK